MKRLIIVAALLYAAPAMAQAPGPAIPVPMTDQEQAIFLRMCDDAVWASRRFYDGFCPILKNKFETATKAETDRAKAAEPPAEKKE